MADGVEKYAPYDAADHLTSAADAALYLQAALDEAGDDPVFVAQVLGDITRSGYLEGAALRPL